MAAPPASPVVVECAACRKRFRVPDVERKPACKHCGGELRAIEAPRRIELDALTCAQCQAINPLGTKFCAECGAALSSEMSAADRAEALRDVAEAVRNLRVLRAWIGGSAALLLILTAVSAAVLVLDGVPRETTALRAWLVVAGLGALGAAYAVAALLLQRQPFFWALLSAAASTLGVVLGIVANLMGNGRVQIGGVMFAIFSWSAVYTASKARRVLRRHPELSAARWYQRELGVIAKEKSARELRELASERAGRRRVLATVGIAVALLAAGYLAFRFVTAPPSFGARAERLTAAWNQVGDVELAAFFAESERASRTSGLQVASALHGWVGRRPPADGAARVEDCGEGCKRVSFACSDGEVVASWRTIDGEWTLAELRTPPAALARRFRDAWNRSDVAAICAFFRTPERTEPALRKSFARRRWTEGLPTAGEPEVELFGDEVFRATFETEGDALVVDWAFENGRWTAQTLDLPSEG